MDSFYYQSLKNLMGIKSNPDKSLLFHNVANTSASEYLTDRIQAAAPKGENDEDIHHAKERISVQNSLVKAILEANGRALILWKVKQLIGTFAKLPNRS